MRSINDHGIFAKLDLLAIFDALLCTSIVTESV